jgi:hypothetical protein
MADTSRDIELRIRVRDLTNADINKLTKSVDDLSGSLDKNLAAASRLEIKEKDLKNILQQLDAAAKNTVGLDALINRYKSVSEQVEKQEALLRKAQAALAAHQAAMESGAKKGVDAERSLLNFEKAVQRAEARVETNAKTLGDLANQLKAAGIAADQLAEAEKLLLASAEKNGNARTKLTEFIRNYAQVEREATEALRQKAVEEQREAEAIERAAKAYRDKVAAIKAANDASLIAFNQQRDSNRLQAENAQQQKIEEAKDLAARQQRATQDLADYNNANLRTQLSGDLDAFNKRIEKQQQLNQFVQAGRQLEVQRGRDQTREATAVTQSLRREQNERREDDNITYRQFIENQKKVTLQRKLDADDQRRGNRQTPGFLGLRPYELTNLGYQVNDVLTGFASGQNPIQILAQQGGQFIQIFGRQVLLWSPIIVAGLGAITVAVAALSSRLQTAASNREFTAYLETNRSQVDQNAVSLTNLRKQLRDVGVGWDEAGKAIKTALDSNIRADRINEVTFAARAMARVTGEDVPTATKDLVDGITGGAKAFDDLIAKYPALNTEQVKYIRNLFETNQTGKAHIEILKLIGDQYRKAEKDSLSPLQIKVEALAASWHKFTDNLGQSQTFDKVITGVQNTVTAVDNLVHSLDELFKTLDKPGVKRFTDIASIAMRPYEAIRDALGGGTFGKVVGGIINPVGALTSDATQPGAIPSTMGPPGPDPRFSFQAGKNIPIDTEQLRILVEGLKEASKYLPPGYSVKAISSERPHATTESGTPSEHAAGRALDVIIVDENGKPIPSLMGTQQRVYDPLFQKFDQVLAAILQNKLPPGTPVAFGGTFVSGGPDAGHYSIGGREAQRTAGRVVPAANFGSATVTGGAQTGTDVTNPAGSGRGRAAGEAELRRLNDELELQRANSREIEKQAILDQKRKELADQRIPEEEQKRILDLLGQQVTLRQKNQELSEQDTRQKSFEGDSLKDRIAIEAAGQAARQRYLKEGITNYEQLYAAQIKGEQDARAELAKRRSEQDQFDAAKKRVDELQRGLDAEHKSALDQINQATNLRYDNEIKQLEKLKERRKNTDAADIDSQISRLNDLRNQQLGRNTLEAAQKQASEALSTRQQIISVANKLEEAGAITIQEKENMTKAAFDATRESILAAADAIEKYLKSAEGLKETPTRIALLTAQMKELRQEVQYIDPFWKGLKTTFTDSFSKNLEGAFNTVTEAIGGALAKTKEWKDVWTGLKNAAANFFAGLLKDLATYILKAQAAKLASELLGGTSVGDFFGIAKPAASALGAAAGAGPDLSTVFANAPNAIRGTLVLHRGAVVGRGGDYRTTPESWWANAPRYHNGTLVGLAPDEQRAILKKGEEVIASDNPRNIMNGGGKSGAINIRNVLVDDPRRVPEAMAGAHGERVILQTLTKNLATVRQLVRG